MDATVLHIVRMAFSVLTDRILTVCTLWMTFGLTCWAMYMPTNERLYVAGGFAILVFLPTLIKERGRERTRQQQELE